MKRIRRRFRSKNETVVFSDRSKIRLWTRLDDDGYRVLCVGNCLAFGSISENPYLSLWIQLEDFNIIISELKNKKYKVARRWLLRYLRKEFTFSGYNISELQLPGSPYIDWNKEYQEK